jgi:hypothetical protein
MIKRAKTMQKHSLLQRKCWYLTALSKIALFIFAFLQCTSKTMTIYDGPDYYLRYNADIKINKLFSNFVFGIKVKIW